MVQVYKIINNIDLVDKNKMFYNVRIYWNKRLPYKIYKRRFRLNIRGNYISNRVTDVWNELPENVVMARTLKSFKSGLNKY